MYIQWYPGHMTKTRRQIEADLKLVQELTKRLGHPPGRQEVPPEVRRRLQEACGSWSNALFQLGYREGNS